ncbi:MAG: dihydrofolate reductase [Gammaproteobacteria bacterium]|jgi:dihydrofolate reductase|nr:MAG: dihydrofolate reductase [Gammaproteobacteria bacterium]
MIVSLIVAMDEQGVIGQGCKLPWRLPADLRRFKSLTLGKPVILGRKTHESIGKPLPGRENIVISRDPDYRSPGCRVADSLDAALAACADAAEVMIAGGAEVYRAALPLADRIYLTEVHARVDGDVHFPVFNRREWREASREELPADVQNIHAVSFVLLSKS